MPSISLTSVFIIAFVLGVNPNTSPGQTTLKADVFSDTWSPGSLEPEVLDLRYSPLYWQSSIGLPDDPHKTVVGSEGTLNYNFKGGYGYSERMNTWVSSSLVGANEYTPTHQNLYDARIPIVITEQKMNGLVLYEETWARAPEYDQIEKWAPRRVDYLWLKMQNRSSSTRTGQVMLQVASDKHLVWEGNTLVKESNSKEKVLTLQPALERTKQKSDSLQQIYFPEQQLSPGEEYEILVTLYPSKFAQPFNRDKEMYEQYEDFQTTALNLRNTAPIKVKEAAEERDRAVAYWKDLSLPYDRIVVPDKRLQRLLDSSIRNIYQARERKEGEPVFQVGPTMYRGSWAADGPFIMEGITYLGRWKEVRSGIEQQVNKDTGPGGIEFSKKTGLRLWMIWRHAQLTGDWEWLAEMWPKVKREVNLIKKYRQMSREDASPLNDGLMPEGTGDGGLGGKHFEYTNVYWTLSGLNAAILMADQLEKSILSDWQAEYEEYWQNFDKARYRDKLKDAWGNIYVPPTMRGEEPQLPQRGTWAFMQSVYPGNIYDKSDTLMHGTMDMLDATQQEGLIYGTGWLVHGIWNYAASFYAHAHLWLDHGKKAASTLYAFGNHASPVLTWREEQYPVGQMRGQDYIGDMPHNWASGEFIRLVRHLMILERDDELHLLEGMPQTWTRPGDQTKLSDIPTSFGTMSLTVTMANDGRSARIAIDPPDRKAPEKMVLHLEQFERPIWSITVDERYLGSSGTIEVPTDQPVTLEVEFKHNVEARYSHPRTDSGTKSK